MRYILWLSMGLVINTVAFSQLPSALSRLSGDEGPQRQPVYPRSASEYYRLCYGKNLVIDTETKADAPAAEKEKVIQALKGLYGDNIDVVFKK